MFFAVLRPGSRLRWLASMIPCRWSVFGQVPALALFGAQLAYGQDSAVQGFRLITDTSGGNCIACHALPGQTGVLSSFGPALAGVGSRYDLAQLRQWVSDARVLKPDTLMPPFGTTEGTQRAVASRPMLGSADIDHIVAALQTLR